MTSAAVTSETGDRVAATNAGSTRSFLVWLVPLPVLGALLFGSAGRDDVYITYWAADQLRRTGRITSYNGATLEQSSSLLHVLLLALLSVTTRLSVTTLGPWIAIAAGALCAPVAYRLCARFDARGQWAAAGLVATLPPLVYWSFGGHETSLATLLVLLALGLLARAAEGWPTSKVAVVLVLLGVVLVRPEMGPVFVAGLLVAAGAVRFLVDEGWRGEDGRDRLAAARRVLAAAGIVAAGAFGIAVFRKAYFGAWVPRPVSVKTGSVNIGAGLGYFFDTVVQSLTFVAIVVGAIVLVIRRKALTPAWFVGGALVVVGTVAVIEPGGDWMEGGRLMTPWLAVALVIVAATLGRLAPSTRTMVAGALIVTNVLGLVVYAANYSTGVAAWTHLSSTLHTQGIAPTRTVSDPGYWERRNAVHVRDTLFLQQAEPTLVALQRAVAPRRVVYASPQAGMVLYYLEQHARQRKLPFDFIDRDGLVDDTWDGCRNGISADSVGKAVPWRRVVRGDCGKLPDMISDVTNVDNLPGVLHQVTSKYTPVVIRTDSVQPAAWPHGQGSAKAQWLAVRSDLIPKLRTELRREAPSPS